MEAQLAVTAAQTAFAISAGFVRKRVKKLAEEKAEQLDTAKGWEFVAEQLSTQLENIEVGIDVLRTADLKVAVRYLETALLIQESSPEKFVELMKSAFDCASHALAKVSEPLDKIKAYSVYVISGVEYLSDGGEKPADAIAFTIKTVKEIGADPTIMRPLEQIISKGKLSWFSDNEKLLLREIFDLSLLCSSHSNGSDYGLYGSFESVYFDNNPFNRMVFGKRLELKGKARANLKEIGYEVKCRRCRCLFKPYGIVTFCTANYAESPDECFHGVNKKYAFTYAGKYAKQAAFYFQYYGKWMCCDKEQKDAAGCLGPPHMQ